MQSDRGARAKVPAVMAADHPLSLEIRQAPRRADISGRISGLEQTRGGVGAQVWAHRQDGTAAAKAQPNSEIYQLQHLEPGAWIVEIDDSGERGLPGEQDPRIIFNGRTRRGVLGQAEEGKEAHVDFDFPPLVLVRGRVVGAANPAKRPGDLEWVRWRRADGTEGRPTSMRTAAPSRSSWSLGRTDIASLRQGAAPILLHLDVKAPQAEPIGLPSATGDRAHRPHPRSRSRPDRRSRSRRRDERISARLRQGGPGRRLPRHRPRAGHLDDHGGSRRRRRPRKESAARKITQLVTVPPGAVTLSQDLTFSTGSAELTSEDMAARPRSPCG